MPIDPMTNQKLFDIGVAGVLKQGRKSIEYSSCLYRGPKGTKCAIGHALTDSKAAEFEESLADGVARKLWPEIDEDFAFELQAAHDSCRTPFRPEFARVCRALASRWHLDPSIIDRTLAEEATC